MTTKTKQPSVNAQLGRAIRRRKSVGAEFDYGIMTADRFTKNVQDCVGSDVCYRYTQKGTQGWSDVMRKAANTLVYSNPEMIAEEKQTTSSKFPNLPKGLSYPKNTLLVVKHVLTTPRKDRDGDILRTKGAVIDESMNLLWQHVHTLPIGKYITTSEHNEKRLVVISAVIDISSTAQDSAKMIDNGMGRFSHGFKALEFTKLKGANDRETQGKPTGGGFDVKRFEIMEESHVSVPSNTDAEALEVLLSMVEGGKLTSPIMKDVGKSIREKRPLSTSIRYKETMGDYSHEIETTSVADFETIFNKTTGKQNGKPDDNKSQGISESGCGCEKPQGECGCGKSAPEETDGDGDQGKSTPTTEKHQVTGVKMYGYGQIDGSWESYSNQLRDSLKSFCKNTKIDYTDKDYCYVVATFTGYVIACVEKYTDSGRDKKYYRIGWTVGDDDMLKFTGEPKEVDVQTTTRVIEKKNWKALLNKANKPTKEQMLCPKCQGVLKKTDDGMHCSKCDKTYTNEELSKDGKQTDEFTVKDAMALILTDASPFQQKTLYDSLGAIQEIHKRSKTTDLVKSIK